MKSDIRKIKKPKLVVTSNLASLLKERSLTQWDLARIAGVSRKTVNRLKNRRIVRRIDCLAAAKICAALSEIAANGQKTKTAVRLDALFPMVFRREPLMD